MPSDDERRDDDDNDDEAKDEEEDEEKDGWDVLSCRPEKRAWEQDGGCEKRTRNESTIVWYKLSKVF
jgi:hypothetical protein